MLQKATSKHPDLVHYMICPDSPAGKLLVGFDEEKYLVRVSFLCGTSINSLLDSWHKDWPHTNFISASKEISFATLQKQPLSLIGTEFQHEVWKGLFTIKEGQTLSYGALAARIKRPKAARAVGSACGKNPIALIVPCHRVIASNGTLGGFSANIEIKKSLLEKERI